MSGASSDDTDAAASQAREGAGDDASAVRLATDVASDDRAAARSSDESAREGTAAPHAAGESAHDVGSSAGKAGESDNDVSAPARPVGSVPHEAVQATSDAHKTASEAFRLANEALESTSDARELTSAVHVPASEAQHPASDALEATSDAPHVASDALEATRTARSPTGRAHDSEGEARKTTREAQGPTSEAPRPTNEARATASDPHPRTTETGPAKAVPSAPTRLADYRHRVTRTSVTEEAFRAFLARADTRRWVRAIVKAKVPGKVVNDVTQDALEEAVKAFGRSPPSKDEVLIVWIATITRRVVADFLKKRGRRRKYEGDMPRTADTPSLDSAYDTGLDSDDQGQPPLVELSYDPREDSVDDLELKGGLLFRWLERQVANHPIDRETFEIVLEHGLGEKTYQTIARERGITLTVLSSRIFAFRNKYVPRYKRERHRTWLLLLLFGTAVVVVVVWLLSRHEESPSGTSHPSTTPVLDELFGGPLPVGHARPNDRIEPDAGIRGP